MKSMIPALYIVLLFNTLIYSQKHNSSSLKTSTNSTANNNIVLSTATRPDNINTITWTPIIYNGYNGVYGGTPLRVNALAVLGDSVYVGGKFNSAGGSTHNNITLWTGSSWVALGSEVKGVNNEVNAAVVYGGNLIVGGIFDAAGGNSISNLAKWDGASWSALGGVVNAGVYALATSGSNLYAGGLFTTAGGSSANYIAKWNDSSWTTLGGGLNGVVKAIAVSGDSIYAGGTFTSAGGVTVSNIAKWNGTSWSALGAGVDGSVNAIEISGTDVYVGGNFSTAGDSAASYIAKWNGSTWSKLGDGPGDYSMAIKVSGSDVYVGTNSNMKKYSGIGWSTVGDGTSSTVYALAIKTTGDTMYVGGNFTSAGGSTANRIAKFTDTDNPLPVELTSFTGRRNSNGIELNWITATEVNNYGFEIERTALPTSMQQSSSRNWRSITFVPGYGNSNSQKQYSYTDYCKITEGYTYRLKQIDTDGGFSYSTELNVQPGNPARFELLQNYPNPFNPATDIKFSLPVSGVVKLEIYNILGIKVATVINEAKEAGEYSVPFEAKGLPTGIYLYRLQCGDFTQVKKMTLIK